MNKSKAFRIAPPAQLSILSVYQAACHAHSGKIDGERGRINMHTIVVNRYNIEKYAKYWRAQFQLRREIFIDRLGWALNSHDGMEFDEFDTPVTEYVICINAQDQVVGISRLMPTSQPYMIEKYFSANFAGVLPKTAKSWEATRFGVSENLTKKERSEVIDAITSRIYRFGQENDITEFLLLMPLFIYRRILIPRGFDLEILCDAWPCGGLPIAVARVHVYPAEQMFQLSC